MSNMDSEYCKSKVSSSASCDYLIYYYSLFSVGFHPHMSFGTKLKVEGVESETVE